MVSKIFKRAAIFTALFGMLMTAFVACGEAVEKDPSEAYMDLLKEDMIYIRHEDYTVEQVYMPYHTLSSEKIESGNINHDRVLWFKEDWANVPTLYKGDALIYYTPSDFNEVFTFERFFDQGYSIGLRKLGYTSTGRVYVSTGIDKKLTYPNGDTDVINDFKSNSYLIIDALGGTQLRYENLNTRISDYGFLTGLEKDRTYTVEIYNGTIKNVFEFTANVRVLGSAEYDITTDFNFVNGRIIEIPIPKDWNSGYYLINGLGMFRYVNGLSYDDDTDFNIPNPNPIDAIYYQTEESYLPDDDPENNDDGDENYLHPSDEEFNQALNDPDDAGSLDIDRPENTYHYADGIYTYGDWGDWPTDLIPSGSTIVSAGTSVSPADEVKVMQEYEYFGPLSEMEPETSVYYVNSKEAGFYLVQEDFVYGKYTIDFFDSDFASLSDPQRIVSLKTPDGRYIPMTYTKVDKKRYAYRTTLVINRDQTFSEPPVVLLHNASDRPNPTSEPIIKNFMLIFTEIHRYKNN